MSRVCKALLVALTADVASASRNHLKVDKTASAHQVMDRINALLQTRGLGTAKTSITPEAQESMNSALTRVVTEIEEKVESRIKEGHRGTQEAINKAIDELKGSTDQAVQRKNAANMHDQYWFDCVKEEKAKRVAIEEAEKALAQAQKEQVAPCQQQDYSKMFTAQPDADKFVCDISEHGNCQPQMSSYQAHIDGLVAGVRTDATAATASWTEAKKQCDAAKYNVAEKQAALEAANKAWRAQRQSCMTQHENRAVAMCLFGRHLQGKCEHSSAYLALIAEVEKVNGGEHSHPDRQQEWKVTSMTKCMLEKVISGSDIDNGVLDTCEGAVNYDASVGALDKKADEYARLTAADKFTCSESYISFIGQNWNVPEGEAPASSEYTTADFQPAVNLDPSAAPFGFCQA